MSELRISPAVQARTCERYPAQDLETHSIHSYKKNVSDIPCATDQAPGNKNLVVIDASPPGGYSGLEVGEIVVPIEQNDTG